MDKNRTMKTVAVMAMLISAVLSPVVLSPRAVARADSGATVTNVTQIYSESQRGAKGLGVWPDGTMGVLQNGSSYQWFSANGAAQPNDSVMTSGPLTDPAQTVNYTSKGINGVPANIYNYTDVGPVYKDNAGNIISFVHLERWPGGNGGAFWGALAMAVSKDGGSSWTFCGEIIQHNLAYDPTATTSYEVSSGNYQIVNAGGMAYFYVYATDATSSGQRGISVSRASVSAVTGAADASTCTAPTFHKWYNGGWDSAPAAWLNGTGGAPQGGPFSDILSAPGQYGGYPGEENISYNSYLGQYILAYNASTGSNAYGIALRISSNPLDFSGAPDHLIAGDASHDATYQTFVGEGTNPETTSGQEFYVYYITWPTSGGPFDSGSTLQRATITVGGSGTAAFNRYVNSSVGDHWVTTGSVTGGYALEGTLAYLYTSQQSGTVPLYGCLNGSVDHFISLQSNCEGQTVLRTEGYLYNSLQSGTTPLYRCKVGGDHFVSTDPNCEGQTVEFLLGYALTNSSGGGSYQASSGFSATQGQNQWSYEYSTNGEASFAQDSYDSANVAWYGPGGTTAYCDIWPGSQHPGIGCDSVRVWTAPRAGTVTIGSNGNITVASACGGSGVQIRILKNGTQIWPTSGWQTLANGASYTFPGGVTTSVNANDQIQFVDAIVGSNNNCDSTTWDQTVAYN